MSLYLRPFLSEEMHCGLRVFRCFPLYVQIPKGYTTVVWPDGAVFCGLVFDLQLAALIDVLRYASGVT